MKIVLAGGTGFIGQALLRNLIVDGHRVVILARDPSQVGNGYGGSVSVERWDGRTVAGWASHIATADAVINLAGASVAGGRWTSRRKDLLLKSRIEPTRALVDAILQHPRKPSVLVNASAVGYYGDAPKFDVTETAPSGGDFLATLVRTWEQEAQPVSSEGVRAVFPRFGVVLEKNGGALPRLLMPFGFYAGGWLGEGSQWFPWVHREDAGRAVIRMIENTALSGPVNVVAPQVISMKEFCMTIGRVLHKPCWAEVPAFVLRILLGEMADMFLTGQRVIPQKLLEARFDFLHPTAESALRSILLPSSAT